MRLSNFRANINHNLVPSCLAAGVLPYMLAFTHIFLKFNLVLLVCFNLPPLNYLPPFHELWAKSSVIEVLLHMNRIPLVMVFSDLIYR